MINEPNKDIPIFKKKIKDLLKGVHYTDKLLILEPLCAEFRQKSSVRISKETNKFVTSKKLSKDVG